MIAGIIVALIVIALVAYAVFVYTSVNRFAGQWSAQNGQAVSQDSHILVALGDSTVQGIGATSIGKGFVGQLAKKLSGDRPVQIYNYSKTGAVAKDVLANQLGNIDKLKTAGVIVIAVGPNDMTRGVAKDEYLKTYQAILDKLPKPKVVIASIPPLERSSVSTETVQEWNRDLEKLAAKNKVRVAPVYQAIKPRSRDPRIYSIDLFHPSNTGYGLWAGAFYGPAHEILMKSSPRP